MSNRSDLLEKIEHLELLVKALEKFSASDGWHKRFTLIEFLWEDEKKALQEELRLCGSKLLRPVGRALAAHFKKDSVPKLKKEIQRTKDKLVQTLV